MMMLAVNDISFSYGKKTVIEKLGFSASAGECVVIAGPNGSGKSTALSVIAGALPPSSGTVTLHGRLGYVPQGAALFEDATVIENLRFFASVSHRGIPERLPFDVWQNKNKRVSKLSGGMKKQVSIACALLGDPDIILLDEPCAALDVSFRDEMIDLVCDLKTQGKAVVYVGHDPAEYRSFFDKLVLLGDTPRVYMREELSAQLASEGDFTRFYKNTLLNIKGKVSD